MKTLIERSLCVGVLAVASCAPTAGEQAQQPARAHAQTARALVGNLRRTEAPQPQQMAEYVGRYSAATGRITFEPLLPQGSGGLPRPGYTQLISNTVSLRDNGTTVGAGGVFGGETCSAGQICAVVTVSNDSTRQIENMRVEIVDLAAGASVANPDPLALNYPSTAGNAGGWSYSTIPPSGSNSVPWRFNTTAGADFNFNVRVWGVYTRTGYSAGGRGQISPTNNVVAGNAAWSDGAPAWRDACLFGSTLASVSNQSSFATELVTPPFPFTFYDLMLDSEIGAGAIEVSSVGTVSAFGVPDGSNGALSYLSAPDYTIYPFWDGLDARSATVCEGVDPTSAAPNRRWVITWKNMSFPAPSTAVLTFSVVVQEQSDNIYFLYHRYSSTSASCAAASGPSIGGTATFGVRGNGVGQYTQIQVDGSPSSSTLMTHLAPCPGAGTFFKLTATPANP